MDDPPKPRYAKAPARPRAPASRLARRDIRVIVRSFVPLPRDAICIDGRALLPHEPVKKAGRPDASHPIRSQFISACRFTDNNSDALTR